MEIKKEPIVKIDRLADVVPKTKEIAHLRKQSGGMRCTLENQLMAYWKPCTIKTGNGETYISEIISFHIDRLLQFNRAPVVVTRFITNPDILHLAGELQVHFFSFLPFLLLLIFGRIQTRALCKK